MPGFQILRQLSTFAERKIHTESVASSYPETRNSLLTSPYGLNLSPALSTVF